VKGNVYQWKNSTFRFSYMWETILEQFNEEVHKLEKGERNLTIKSLAGPLKNFKSLIKCSEFQFSSKNIVAVYDSKHYNLWSYA
jgi:hypothetical protein